MEDELLLNTINEITALLVYYLCQEAEEPMIKRAFMSTIDEWGNNKIKNLKKVRELPIMGDESLKKIDDQIKAIEGVMVSWKADYNGFLKQMIFSEEEK